MPVEQLVVNVLAAALMRLAADAREHVQHLLDVYLYQTVDAITPGGGAFTANPALHGLSSGLVLAADALIAVVVLGIALRTMFDHGTRSPYELRLLLPRLLAAVVMVHCSLPLIQMAIDLDNALCRVALSLGTGDPSATPWSSLLAAATSSGAGHDLFLALFMLAVVVALVLLAMALVIRYALLGILVVTAPLAALCTVLPETRGYAHTWTHLFTQTVFMQAVQLLVLRIAVSIAISGGELLPSAIYSLATLWLMLKVPGALNTAAHLSTHAKTVAHHLQKAAVSAVHPAHHVVHRASAS